MRGKTTNVFLFLIGLLLAVNFVRSSLSVSEKGKIIEDTKERLIAEGERNSKLKRELAKIESPAYIEKEAREKLNLGREGEYVVILPPITPTVNRESQKEITNLEAWVKVFWP